MLYMAIEATTGVLSEQGVLKGEGSLSLKATQFFPHNSNHKLKESHRGSRELWNLDRPLVTQTILN